MASLQLVQVLLSSGEKCCSVKKQVFQWFNGCIFDLITNENKEMEDHIQQKLK